MTFPRNYKGTITKSLTALTTAFGKKAPDVAVILGSGLGSFTQSLSKPKKLPFAKIPGFPKTKVPGHVGECVLGTIGNKRVLVFAGRFHFYEGHSPYITTLPVRVCGAWGIKDLIVTNAAGGIREGFQPGSLMLIRDHINLAGANPLRGPNLEKFGPRFVDMTEAYDFDYRALAQRVARDLNIDLTEGVYAGLSGPNYETPSEIVMLNRLGADAVGMSTVAEVIVARHQDMRVLGISCITNAAAGISRHTISHEEVMESTQKAEREFAKLLSEVIASQ